jgi:hypothetical protein
MARTTDHPSRASDYAVEDFQGKLILILGAPAVNGGASFLWTRQIGVRSLRRRAPPAVPISEEPHARRHTRLRLNKAGRGDGGDLSVTSIRYVRNATVDRFHRDRGLTFTAVGQF